MPEYLAPGVYIEETSYRSETDDSFDFATETETSTSTSDSEWLYVPVRRTADADGSDELGGFGNDLLNADDATGSEDGEVISFGNDWIVGGTGQDAEAIDPYSSFNFQVDWG